MKKIFESENGAKMGGALMLARCDVRFSSPFSCTDQKEVTRKLSTCQKRYLTTVFCPSRPTILHWPERHANVQKPQVLRTTFGSPVDPHTHTHTARLSDAFTRQIHTHTLCERNNCRTTPHSRTGYEHAKQHVLERCQQVFLEIVSST